MGRVYDTYHMQVERGELGADFEQAVVAKKLDALCEALDAYEPGNEPNGVMKWLGLSKQQPAPQGLYIHGDVGRGKTMLMDMFYDLARTKPKSRIHFHEFMQKVHSRVHHWRKQHDDPIPPVAAEIAAEATLLCFDEFQVTDITDAMILGRLFTALFEHGIIVVATSNIEPEGLYEHGLNRNSFLPFIKLMQQKMQVVSLDGEKDYRLDRLMGHKVYVTPLGAEADVELQTMWEELTECESGPPMELEVTGRTLMVPQAARSVARFDFSDLCEKPLGPGDFLKIAKTFHTVIVENIPKLSKARRNEAKRFVILIDALYDNHVRLIASAAVAPAKIYPEGDHAFEFNRTASRLVEMQSEEYLMAPQSH
ncbi:MAG: cell division protein ZapE [Rhizobiales bacterium]|nr:cell division protein ZapE [Hyphomicrobiales bacterium]